MDISKKIKLLMVEHNLTATELSKLIGISQSYFSKKMKNNDWTITDLEKIAAALKISLNVTFKLEDGRTI